MVLGFGGTIRIQNIFFYQMHAFFYDAQAGKWDDGELLYKYHAALAPLYQPQFVFREGKEAVAIFRAFSTQKGPRITSKLFDGEKWDTRFTEIPGYPETSFDGDPAAACGDTVLTYTLYDYPWPVQGTWLH
ncbi:MAG: hypothetical protein V1794_01510 [Candidatus Glassbacteria bacterium]